MAATTTMDLSGLTSLTYAQTAAGRSFNVGVATNAASIAVLNLSNGTNTITATNMTIGNGGGPTTVAAPGGNAVLNLGTTNVINTDALVVGGYRSTSGALQFATGLTNPTLTLRGAAGGTTPVASVTVGLVQAGGVAQTGTLNTSLGSINAIVNNLFVYQVGTTTPNANY